MRRQRERGDVGTGHRARSLPRPGGGSPAGRGNGAGDNRDTAVAMAQAIIAIRPSADEEGPSPAFASESCWRSAEPRLRRRSALAFSRTSSPLSSVRSRPRNEQTVEYSRSALIPVTTRPFHSHRPTCTHGFSGTVRASQRDGTLPPRPSPAQSQTASRVIRSRRGG